MLNTMTAKPQHVLRILLAISIVTFISSRANAGLPTLDSAAQTEVVINGLSFKVIKDSDVEGQWYYVPPRLRLAEKGGIPEARVLIYVADGRENAIVQAEVTAAATKQEQDAMIAQVRQWYTDKGIKTPQIALSIIGPLRSSTFRMLTLKNAGNAFSLKPLWDPVGKDSPVTFSVEKNSELKVEGDLSAEELPPDGSGEPAPGVDEKVIEPATIVNDGEVTLKTNQKIQVENASPDLAGSGITIPGSDLRGITISGSDLSQNVPIQFEISGAGVQIYEELLKGKSGGLALVWVGEYDAMSMPAKVEIELNVRAAQTYFRKYERKTKRRRFLFWGKNSTQVSDFLRTSNFLDRSLTVKIDGNPEVLSDHKLDQISDSLMKWVLGQCFRVKQVPGTAKGAITSVNAPNTELDLGNFSTLFGLPPLSKLGLNIGFSSGSSSYIADYRTDNNIRAKASWNRRTIVKRSLAIPGNVSFGNYSQSEDLITRVKIKSLPKAYVRLPRFADKERQAMLTNAAFTLKLPAARGDSKYTWLLDTAGSAWRFPGDPAALGIDEETRLKEFPNCPRMLLNAGEVTKDITATLILNRLNGHLGHQPAEMDRLELPPRGFVDESEVIDFAGERFPLRQAELDLSQFPFSDLPGGVSSVRISCGVEPVLDSEGNPLPGTVKFLPRLLNRDPVSLPTFTVKRKDPVRFLYPGEITGVKAEVTYTDLFNRNRGTHDWTVRTKRSDDELNAVIGEEILARLAFGSGSVVLQPVDIGIKDFRINTNYLFNQFPEAILITAEFTGEGGGSFSKEWIRPTGEESRSPFQFVTKEQIKTLTLAIDNDNGTDQKYRLAEERIEILNSSVGTSNLLRNHFERID